MPRLIDWLAYNFLVLNAIDIRNHHANSNQSKDIFVNFIFLRPWFEWCTKLCDFCYWRLVITRGFILSVLYVVRVICPWVCACVLGTWSCFVLRMKLPTQLRVILHHLLKVVFELGSWEMNLIDNWRLTGCLVRYLVSVYHSFLFIEIDYLIARFYNSDKIIVKCISFWYLVSSYKLVFGGKEGLEDVNLSFLGHFLHIVWHISHFTAVFFITIHWPVFNRLIYLLFYAI